MANITQEINQINTAVYGKDVRSSLANGLTAMNKENEYTLNGLGVISKILTGKDILNTSGINIEPSTNTTPNINITPSTNTTPNINITPSTNNNYSTTNILGDKGINFTDDFSVINRSSHSKENIIIPFPKEEGFYSIAFGGYMPTDIAVNGNCLNVNINLFDIKTGLYDFFLSSSSTREYLNGNIISYSRSTANLSRSTIKAFSNGSENDIEKIYSKGIQLSVGTDKPFNDLPKGVNPPKVDWIYIKYTPDGNYNITIDEINNYITHYGRQPYPFNYSYGFVLPQDTARLMQKDNEKFPYPTNILKTISDNSDNIESLKTGLNNFESTINGQVNTLSDKTTALGSTVAKSVLNINKIEKQVKTTNNNAQNAIKQVNSLLEEANKNGSVGLPLTGGTLTGAVIVNDSNGTTTVDGGNIATGYVNIENPINGIEFKGTPVIYLDDSKNIWINTASTMSDGTYFGNTYVNGNICASTSTTSESGFVLNDNNVLTASNNNLNINQSKGYSNVYMSGTLNVDSPINACGGSIKLTNSSTHGYFQNDGNGNVSIYNDYPSTTLQLNKDDQLHFINGAGDGIVLTNLNYKGYTSNATQLFALGKATTNLTLENNQLKTQNKVLGQQVTNLAVQNDTLNKQVKSLAKTIINMQLKK